MSSPPNTGGSPPYASHLNIPRKRPSINTSLSSSSNFKRHKAASSASSSAHPLRQTSFPPPEQAVASPGSPSYSPPAEGSVTGRSSTVGTGKRKRGRPRASDARSTTAGSGRASKANSASGRASVADGAADANAREEEEPEDDENEAGVDTVLEGGGVADEAQLKVERQNMRMLIEAFSNDQADRYDMWRRVRLDKATLRRLVNHTLSQSVPPSVITTINGYTKLFIGELIERARDVQDEWLAAELELPTGELKPHLQKTAQAAPVSGMSNGTATQSSTEGQPSSNTHSQPSTANHDANGINSAASMEGDSTSINDTKQTSQDSSNPDSQRQSLHQTGRFTVEERDRGPLTADHLREALRRYKKDREGGSSGFQGLSMQGNNHVASRVGGRRLFR